jgi:hypothetical protein
MTILNWLGERARYLIRWPVNLVRDLPVRLIRLLQTAKRLILGILFFLPELIDAIRHREIRQWTRYKLGRIIDWLHHLAAQLFDLIGGPELGQFFFHFFTNTTPLTAEEITMMSEIIGPDAIRYHETRVAQGGILSLIFKLNGNLAFATWRTINIPRTGRHTRENKPLIAHELTHVYQYEMIGSRYLGEAIYMLIKTKRDCYDYGGRNGLVLACSAGIHYSDYNREQQAMIVQDYCALQQMGADVSAYQPFITEVQQGLF